MHRIELPNLSACKMQRLNQTKCHIFQFNAGLIEYAIDPVEYTTEVRQLI